MYFLGFTWNPDDTLFKLGVLQIKYYNLLWIIAFAVGWYIMKRIFDHENKSREQLDSLFVYTVLATMLGARLGHVFFYDWAYYKNHLLEILLPIRERAGSTLFGIINGYEFTGFTCLASHGAAIGVIIGMYLFTRKHREFNVFYILYRIVIPISLGGFLVRLGNFFNSEILGRATDLPWAVWFRMVDPVPVGVAKAMAADVDRRSETVAEGLRVPRRLGDRLEHPAGLGEAELEGACGKILEDEERAVPGQITVIEEGEAEDYVIGDLIPEAIEIGFDELSRARVLAAERPVRLRMGLAGIAEFAKYQNRFGRGVRLKSLISVSNMAE